MKFYSKGAKCVMYYAWHLGTKTPVIQTNPDYVPWYLQEQPIWAPSAGSITPTSGPLNDTGISEIPQAYYSLFWEQIHSCLRPGLYWVPVVPSPQGHASTSSSLVTPKLQTLDTTGLIYWSGVAVTTCHDVHSHPLLYCILFKFLLQVPLLPSPPTNTADPTLPGFSYSLLAILIGTMRPPGSQSLLVATRARIQIASFSAFFLYNQLKIL